MKNRAFLIIIFCIALVAGCKKEKESEKFTLLTSHPWMSDSLIAKSADAAAAQTAQLFLENFRGEAMFNKDLTGYFGVFTGTWHFAYNETALVIESPSLPATLSTTVVELTTSSLKVTLGYPNVADPTKPINIRMTFKDK